MPSWLVDWQAGGDTKRRQKCNPLVRNSVQNATPFVRNRYHNACLLALQQSCGKISGAENRTPYHEIAQKTRPLGRNSMSKLQKWQLFIKNTVKNATPWPKICPKASRIRILSTSDARNTVKYIGWIQNIDRRAGGPAERDR